MKVQTLLFAAGVAAASAFTVPGPVNGAGKTSLSAVESETSTSLGAEKMSALTSDVKTIFNTEDIDNILPHRYPFALVDKVVEYEAGMRIYLSIY